MSKICTICKIEKDISEFPKRKLNNDGLYSWCKKCVSEKSKKYREQNRERVLLGKKKSYLINREKIASDQNIFYLQNKEKILARNKKYRDLHKEKSHARHLRYYATHKDKYIVAGRKRRVLKKNELSIWRSSYTKKRKKIDLNYKLSILLRRRIGMAIKHTKKQLHAPELIGCSLDFLKIYLQQTAIANGYLGFDINNYDGRKYHIDHIVPCAAFNLGCKYHQLLCFNYSNMQILKSEVNLSKHSKFELLKVA